MDIRFTSTLTPEDENAVAAGILKAFAGILDLLPIAYTIRIDTSDARVYQHSSANLPHGLNADRGSETIGTPSAAR